MLAFPFDSRVEVVENPITHEPETQFDRAVSSQPMRHLMRKLFTTGIMPDLSDNYLVSAGTDGMTVVVHSGFAVVDGGLALETEDRTLEVTAADTTLDRIDTVVLRWNENVDVRTADLYVVSGTPSANPVRPELQRGESIYEIGLADIFITRSVATITNEKITDTRYEAERCGVVRSISEYDTTYIYQQVQADLASFKANEQAEFVAWFESIQDILDENVAAHLQSEIDDLDGRLGTFEDAIENYTNGLGNTSIKNIGDGTVTGVISQLHGDLTKKALVNTYYDSSVSKLYKVNDDGTKGSEISMGGVKRVLRGKKTIGSTTYTAPVTIAIPLGTTVVPSKCKVTLYGNTNSSGDYAFTCGFYVDSLTSSTLTLGFALNNLVPHPNSVISWEIVEYN